MTEEIKTLTEILLYNADKLGDRDCFYFGNINKEEEAYSYKKMLSMSMRFADYLISAGMKQGDRVIIILPTCVEYLVSFFAVILAGGTAVPVAPIPFGANKLDYYFERLNHVAENSEAAFVVVDNKGTGSLMFNHIHAMFNGKSKTVNISSVNLHESAKNQVYMAKQDDICFIQYTSGSTGKAKGVPITHKSLFTNVKAITEASGITENDFMVSWMPLFHDMGLVGGMMTPIYNQFPVLLFSTEHFIYKPLDWFKFIFTYKATISPGNNFAFSYCVKRIKETNFNGIDLSSWRLAHNGAEPINADIVRLFYEKFKGIGFRETTMLPCYGLAEATLAVTIANPDEATKVVAFSREGIIERDIAEIEDKESRSAVELVSLGTCIPNISLKIVDKNCMELEEGSIGEICIKGPSVIKGYYNSDSSDCFNGEWLKTGDMGFLCNGELFITGRKKELIIVRGKNYFPVDIENIIINSLDNLIPICVAFSFFDLEKGKETVVIVFETKSKDEEMLQDLAGKIKKVVLSNFGISIDYVFNERKLPRTFNGKIKRNECRSKYMEVIKKAV